MVSQTSDLTPVRREYMDKEKMEKKDHILDVAEKMFSELGFEGASTRTIARAADVNIAMLHYYFGSKEGLFLAVFERKISSLKSLLQNIGNSDTLSSWGKMEICINSFVDRFIVNSRIQKLVNREISSGKKWSLTDKLTDVFMINIQEFKKILIEGIKTGDFQANADPEMVTATIFGIRTFVINAPQLSSLLFGNDITDKFLAEEVRPRVKTFIITLLKAYLVKNHDYTNK
jgi:AcrR family transcriptional regulator